MHHPQPLHLSCSTDITPVSSDCVKASRGHAATQGGSSHSLHVTAMFTIWFILTTRIPDFSGLNTLSLVSEQTYSHIWHPTHLSGSAEMNFLSCILGIFSSFISELLELDRPFRVPSVFRWSGLLPLSSHGLHSNHPKAGQVLPECQR